MCRGCRKEIPGVQLQKAGTDRAMLYSDKNCLDCTKEQMDKVYNSWKEAIKYKHRNIYKGCVISPFHHYKAKIFQKELEELDDQLFI